MGKTKFAVMLALAVTLSACAAPGSGGGSSGATSGGSAPGQAAAPSQPAKTLIVITRAEPPSLTSKPFRPLGLTQDLSGWMFNAGLTVRNDQGVPTPRLAT